jgi:dTDP-4-amino-4,6-dideoxygalactose transaminase
MVARFTRVPFYDIKAQYDELQQPLDQAVHEVLSGGVYTISGGKQCGMLEEELAEFHQVKHGISVHSGTDALRIMLDAVGVGRGDEVITTAFTFVASVETIVQTGATPVYVDIDPVTYNIDADKIEAAITPKTKAIMPIHLFGQMADVTKIGEIAKKHNLIVLEDAAQAVGCSYNGVPAGNFGSAAGLSFYVTKNLGAAGDAGLILTNDDNVAEVCRSIRVHGMGRQRYYYDHLGYTARMDEIQAAVLRVKLKKLREWNERRSRIAEVYLEKLAGSGIQAPVTQPGNVNTWHQFSIRSSNREAFMSFLKERGVDSMIYYPVPIHFHAPYEKFGHGPGSLPESEKASLEIVNLPINPHMTMEMAHHVIDSVLAFEG